MTDRNKVRAGKQWTKILLETGGNGAWNNA